MMVYDDDEVVIEWQYCEGGGVQIYESSHS